MEPPRSVALYPDDMLVSEARDSYLEAYDLGDGGHEVDWSFAWMGWIPVVVPNSAARKKALPAHDMHHLVTGSNGVISEGEIDVAAFELGSGGCDPTFLFGCWTMLALFAFGLVLRPRHLYRKFMLGRRSKNLFVATVGERTTSLTMAELRARLLPAEDAEPIGRRDRRAFVLHGVAGVGMLSCAVAASLATLARCLS